ncbi:hypothetical protein J6590_001046 [Homalodisca vitripennis]|nr:hypothetical protein J6590_001046 [Homalodisca vitripennis]
MIAFYYSWNVLLGGSVYRVGGGPNCRMVGERGWTLDSATGKSQYSHIMKSAFYYNLANPFLLRRGYAVSRVSVRERGWTPNCRTVKSLPLCCESLPLYCDHAVSEVGLEREGGPGLSNREVTILSHNEVRVELELEPCDPLPLCCDHAVSEAGMEREGGLIEVMSRFMIARKDV